MLCDRVHDIRGAAKSASSPRESFNTSQAIRLYVRLLWYQWVIILILSDSFTSVLIARVTQTELMKPEMVFERGAVIAFASSGPRKSAQVRMETRYSDKLSVT